MQQCATRSKTPTFRDRPRQEHDSGESEAESNESRGGVLDFVDFQKGCPSACPKLGGEYPPNGPLKIDFFDGGIQNCRQCCGCQAIEEENNFIFRCMHLFNFV